jgi:RNA polymerase sigma-70 factor, ECF subfamily
VKPLLSGEQQTDQNSKQNRLHGAPSDTELIQRTLMGDESAYRTIVERYESQVAATVIGMLGSGPESEDVGQETFIRLYRSLKNIRGESGLGTYLTRIAINLCLDSTRRLQRRRHWFRIDDTDEALPEGLTTEEGGRIEASERKEWVARAVCSLDPKHRAVVVLRMISGYSTRETAELLDIPVGTVLSRLSRAEEKLRLILRPLIED